MDILAIGINHKSSSIDIRERFYLQPLERELLLSEFKSDPRIAESFIISTCNRTEIYASVIENDPEILIERLFKIKRISSDADFKNHFYIFRGRQAVEHLLRVTAGLDSLIIGEKQILGQVKEAFEFAKQRGTMGKTFNILSNLVLQTGKKARHETTIDGGGSSVSWASVIMAQHLLGSLRGKSVLILGSGKIGRLALEQLAKKEVSKIYIMNRTIEKAEELARASGGTAVAFWQIKEILSKVDVCICSASCPHYLIDKGLVEETMAKREGRKLVCIDISMPRNIAPEVGAIEDVALVVVDDLDKAVASSIQKRLSAVGAVESIIVKKVNEFYKDVFKPIPNLLKKQRLLLF